MKKFAPYFLFLALSLPLCADNWLQNGDFTDGLDHWRGNGRSPADMASDDPFAKPDPLLSTGLIIPLKGRQWTTVTQNFRTKAAQLVLTISVIFAPGVTFSERDEDYTNIPDKIDNRLYLSFNLSQKHWFVLFTDFGNGAKGVYYTFDTKPGSTEPQGFRAEVSNLSPLEDELVTIGFPPGQGNVILRSVSLEGN